MEASEQIPVLRRLIRLIRGRRDPSDPHEENDPDSAAVGYEQEITLDQTPELLESGDREAMQRAVGWLASVPEIPFTVAEAALDACLEQLNADGFPIRRSAYRGIKAIHEYHPELVEAELPAIAEGIDERYLIVQEACASTVTDILNRSPARASVIYPYLTKAAKSTRDLALEVLIRVAKQHPIVLEPVDPFLRAQFQEPTVERTLLIEAAVARSAVNSNSIAEAVPIVVTWLPTTDRELEEAIIQLLTTWGLAPEEGADRVIRTMLTYLSTGDRPYKFEAATWLVHTLRTDPALSTFVEAWRYNADEWDRLRVAVAIDESTPAGIDVIGPHLLEENDTYFDQFTTEEDESSSTAD